MSTETNTEIRRDLFCGHCGRVSAQTLVRIQRYFAYFFSPSGNQEIEESGSTFVATCGACGQILLYDNIGDQLAAKAFHKGERVYPVSEWRHWAVPKGVCNAYEAALPFMATFPGAFADKAFSALEILCRDRNAQGDSLMAMLRDLSNRSEISSTLADAAQQLLATFNRESTPNGLHVLLLDKLVRTVIAHVFVTPAEIRDLADQVSEATKT